MRAQIIVWSLKMLLVVKCQELPILRLQQKSLSNQSNFYEKVFGWKIVKWKGSVDHWLITTGGEDEPSIDGGLGRRTESIPNQVNYIVVSSIDDFINKINDNGGIIVTPKQSIPTVGYYSFFKDPEDNTFCLMEYESAQ